MLNLVLSYRSAMKSLLLIGQLQIIIGIFLTKSLVPNQIWNISHQNFTYRCALQTFDTKISYSLALKLFQMSYFIMSDFHLQISPRTHILLLLSLNKSLCFYVIHLAPKIQAIAIITPNNHQTIKKSKILGQSDY